MTPLHCRIHILGASGQLGHALLTTQPAALRRAERQTPLAIYTRRDCDLRDADVFSGDGALQLTAGDIVINCAAYTAVDAAEEDADTAYRVNAEAPGELAALCLAKGAHLVHVSTDYVFGGAPRQTESGITIPWETTDVVSPRCVYGASKAAGEAAILDVFGEAPAGSSQAVIVRTSWLFTGPQRRQWGLHGHDFVTTMLRLYRENGKLTVVDDQRGGPTYSLDLAVGIWEICRKLCHSEVVPSLLHASNQGVASWYEFATAIVGIAGGNIMQVNPCTSVEFPTAAQRPAWSMLSPASWNDAGLTPFRSWEEGLSDALSAVPLEPLENTASSS